MKLFAVPGKPNADKLENPTDCPKAKPNPAVDENAETSKPQISKYIMVLGWLLLVAEVISYMQFIAIFGKDYNFDMIFRLGLPDCYNNFVVVLLAASHLFAISRFADALIEKKYKNFFPVLFRIFYIVVAKLALIVTYAIALFNDDKETVSTFVKRGLDFFAFLKNSDDVYDNGTLAERMFDVVGATVFLNLLNLLFIVVVCGEIRLATTKNPSSV